MSISECNDFVLHYYERCIEENPSGDWSDSRYEAGWGLASWFGLLWRDMANNQGELDEIKNALSRIYRVGSQEIRDCVLNATLEHLFESAEIARFFADWDEDKVLSTAYNDALAWSSDKKGPE